MVNKYLLLLYNLWIIVIYVYGIRVIQNLCTTRQNSIVPIYLIEILIRY